MAPVSFNNNKKKKKGGIILRSKGGGGVHPGSGGQRGSLIKHAVILGSLFCGLCLLIVGVNRFHGGPEGNFSRSFATGWSDQPGSNTQQRDSSEGRRKRPNDRLLIVSHGRVMWYNIQQDTVDVLHENRGIYYGGFPGEDTDTLWVVSRPHNWRPDSTAEYLLEIDAVTGEELSEVQIQSKFTHDVVRKGNCVYVCDTGHGDIIVLDFPSMKERSRLKLFTLKQHVNTLSPTDDGHVWAMLHNLGKSAMVKVDVRNGKVVQRIKNVGLRAHGVVRWKDDYMIYLDSDHGSLARVQIVSTEEEHVASPEILWSVDISEQKYYLKGLCIVDDIAYFGIAISQERKSRADESLNCELAAFDLNTKSVLWRRVLPTKGLLNVVSAPHLDIESTAKAVMTTHEHGVEKNQGMELPPGDPLLAYPPQIGGYWDSGHPRLDNGLKNRKTGFAGGVQMLLYKEDVSKLKQALLQMPEDWWSPEVQKKENAFLAGREGNLNQFKPGTSAIHLIFSDRQGEDVFEFPWYSEKFSTHVEPILHRLLGNDVQNIIRVQFAKMPAHSEIKPHVDSGGYSEKGHRIHVVIASNPNVTFKVCEQSSCLKLHTEEGIVFELNNRLKHFVKNDGDEMRIHMVVDVSEHPQERTKLSKGQVCHYNHGKIVCPPQTVVA
ncbi:hypothetical protein PSENEW3_00000236 [Picochlorum sp. SENEW3]|nr:hypothetical protein PSENEW3_00000236 [Picochlorum sp. SENEW3]